MIAGKPVVALLMGSKSDSALMRPAVEVLEEFGIPHVQRVMSAHRTPERCASFAKDARKNGFKILICAAGGAAHLAGVVASHTCLPVIGVPLARTPLAGQDALLATVQMPKGVPVATVAVDGAANAAILAAQILGVGDEGMASKIEESRYRTRAKVIADDDEIANSS